STSQEAVAWGMSGWANWSSRNDKGRPFTERPASPDDVVGETIRSNPKLWRSDPELAPELDDPVGGQPEKLHRALRAFHHPGEQPLAPERHARPLLVPYQLLSAEEEARAHHVEGLAAGRDPGQIGRHVDLVHAAVMDDHAIEAPAPLLHLDPA